MKFVLTRLRTYAAAYASPVSISAPPIFVGVAIFPPVAARTETSLSTVAVFRLRMLSAELLRQVRMVHPYSVGEVPAPSSKKYERSVSRRSKPSPFNGFRNRTRPSELKRLVLTTFKTCAVETAFPARMLASPSPPSAVFSPVSACVESVVVRVASLSTSLVTMEPLVTPGPSTFDLLMFNVFFTVVEATASPVNIVPPILCPVPSVAEATAKNGSLARASVEVAEASTTGLMSPSSGGGAPSVMFSKSVLSVSLSSGATSPEFAVEEEEAVGSSGEGSGSGSGVVSGVGSPDVSPVVLVVSETSGVVVPVPVSIGGSVSSLEICSGSSCGESVESVVGVSGSGRALTTTSNMIGVALLPAASIAVQITVVVPIAKSESGGGTQEAIPAPSKSSNVAGSVYETRAPFPDDASAPTSSWGSMVGGVVSAARSSNRSSMEVRSSGVAVSSAWTKVGERGPQIRATTRNAANVRDGKIDIGVFIPLFEASTFYI